MFDISNVISDAIDLQCAYSTEEILSKHCTFKIGGKCDLMLFPDTREKFIGALNSCLKSGVRFMVLGNGSDMVFGSKGYRGVIISTAKFNSLSVEGEFIKCDAGVNLSALCMAAYENGLSGAERLYGIPGSIQKRFL